MFNKITIVVSGLVIGLAIRFIQSQTRRRRGIRDRASTTGDSSTDAFLDRVIRNLSLLSPGATFSALLESAKKEEDRTKLSGALLGCSTRYNAVMKRSQIRPSLKDSINKCTECAICLEPFVECPSAQCRILPCGHLFHLECIDEWVCLSALSFTDPSRYGRSPQGAFEPLSPVPHCPLCKSRLGVIDARDSRDAFLRALAKNEREYRNTRSFNSYYAHMVQNHRLAFTLLDQIGPSFESLFANTGAEPTFDIA